MIVVFGNLFVIYNGGGGPGDFVTAVRRFTLKVIFEGQFWINLNLPVTNSVIFPVFTPVSSVNKKQ